MYTAALLRGEHGDARSLWDWGIATRSGWWKGRQPFNPDKPRLSSHKDSRLPTDDWFLDYSLAFCALHPATALLDPATDIGWYVHTRQCSREQACIYLYYVEGMGYRDFRAQFAALPPWRKDLLLDLMGANREQFQLLISASPGAYPVEEGEGDDLDSRHIPRERAAPDGRAHISRGRACELRNRGIDRMVMRANRLDLALSTRVA
jgi:hypothetical protein